MTQIKLSSKGGRYCATVSSSTSIALSFIRRDKSLYFEEAMLFSTEKRTRGKQAVYLPTIRYF